MSPQEWIESTKRRWDSGHLYEGAQHLAAALEEIDRLRAEAVLVEVKATESDRIIFSRLEKHQVQELNEHTAIGAPGLLVLVFKDSVHVLSWPIHGFKRGTSIVNKNGSIYLRGEA